MNRLVERIAAWVTEQADLADQGLRAAADSEEEAWFRGRMVALSETERFIERATTEHSSEVENAT